MSPSFAAGLPAAKCPSAFKGVLKAGFCSQASVLQPKIIQQDAGGRPCTSCDCSAHILPKITARPFTPVLSHVSSHSQEIKSSLAQNNPPFPGHPHTGLLPGTERGVWIPQSSTLLDLLGLTSSWPPCHHRMVGGAGKKAILQAGNYSPSCSPLSSLRVALLSSLACKGSESSRQALPRSSPGVHSAPGPYLHQCLVAPCFKNEMER